MRVPTADELAAIAAAYLAVAPGDERPAPAEASRWRLAGRLRLEDAARTRVLARAASRWSAAGRLDD